MTYTRLTQVAALVVLAACSRGDGSSNNQVGASAGEVAPPIPAAQQAPAHPGALVKPLVEYTGTELLALARSLQYSRDSIRNRRCRDAAACTAAQSTRRTRVHVAAVVGEDSVGTGNVPTHGVIVARARVAGVDREAMYGMRAGGRFEYLLVVFPGLPGGAPRWQLVQFEGVGNQRTFRSVARGRLRECRDHPFQRGARADFKPCGAAVAGPASMGSTLQAGDPPLWFACLAGCCTAEDGAIM